MREGPGPPPSASTTRLVDASAPDSASTHRVACREHGPAHAPRVVICVHGLTGCARDFDLMASALSRCGYRVVCPDVVGRGDSDWLADPRRYALRQYVADLKAVLADLDAPTVDWIGTSMGGVIGMALAASDDSPVERLVLNDIGPLVPRAALQRLGGHLGSDPWFPDLSEAEAHLRATRAPFGSLTDDQWRAMARRSTRPDPSGGYRLHYDPAVAVRFLEGMDRDIDLWGAWDLIGCPVLALRGRDSDFLLATTAEEMKARGPGADVIEFSGCGHHPALLDPSQIGSVVDWLGPATGFHGT